MNSFHTKRIRTLLTLALAGAAAFAGTAGAAQAAVPVLPPNTPFKLKFAHSGQVLNVPNASKAKDVPLVQYPDVNGFKNDDFTFIKINSNAPGFGPNSYVIDSRQDRVRSAALRHAAQGRAGIVGRAGHRDHAVRGLGPPAVAAAVGRRDGRHRQSGLAMNLSEASPFPGAPVGLWPKSAQFLNDDLRYLRRDVIRAPSATRSGAPRGFPTGVVVDSVNVSVLL